MKYKGFKKDWDKSAPTAEYFKELIRISKNQIILGANHFISKIPFDSSCWIVWDKNNSGNFADCELAWTSFDSTSKEWIGMSNEKGRIHPTQKPVRIYEWLYINYAKDGDKILDTHLGSGSSAIAAYNVNMNLDFTGIEIDKEYFDDAVKRVREQTRQLSLF